MFDAEGRLLYVGKAKNLRARVSNYARPSGHSGRIARMIRETASMMFLTTRTETEALLDRPWRERVERLAARMTDLLPARPPASLLHGDLWAGNMLVRDGQLVAAPVATVGTGGDGDEGATHARAALEVAQACGLPVVVSSALDTSVGIRAGLALAAVVAVSNTVEAGSTIEIGPFKVELFHICHSIPDAVGLGITTPAGLVVHMSDFKFDHTPTDGRPADLSRLARWGRRTCSRCACPTAPRAARAWSMPSW